MTNEGWVFEWSGGNEGVCSATVVSPNIAEVSGVLSTLSVPPGTVVSFHHTGVIGRIGDGDVGDELGENDLLVVEGVG